MFRERKSNTTLESCFLPSRSQLLGHDIPKNAWVFVNRWGMHASTKYWNNPRKFDPTRFIRDGKIHKPEHFVPFGIGEHALLFGVFACLHGVRDSTNTSTPFPTAPFASLVIVIGSQCKFRATLIDRRC